ncbi:MAG: ABC transporter permease [Deltaproteobacteria bacterium]|nr:ABC transporter permease [Deltaproteobacteria bacterium]
MSVSLSLRLGWRSFLRHKRRSIITGAAISFSLALMLFFVGFSRDAHERMIEQGVRLGVGHVVVQGKGYQHEQSLDHLVADPAAVAKIARSLPGVRHVATRLAGDALIAAGEHSAAIRVTGVDSRAEVKASVLPTKRVKGHYLHSEVGRSEVGRGARRGPADIFLGVKLARKLEVAVGDRVVLRVAPRTGGKTQAAAFVVCGLFRTGVAQIDAFYGEIPIASARDLLRAGHAATQVALLLDDAETSRHTAQELQAKLKGMAVPVEVLPWEVALRELYDGLVLDSGSMYVMLAIIFILMTIGIFNTMLMSVIERTRELGVMMAIGTSRGRLFSMVLAEATMLAIVASGVGLGIGYGLHRWLAATGIDLGKLYGDMEFAGITTSGMVYSHLSVEAMVGWTLTTVVLVLLSALYPAYRATRLQPVDAMRHV